MDGVSGALATVTEFKARCLDLLDRVADGRLERVATKRGKPVAAVVSAREEAARKRAAVAAEIERGWEDMRGSVSLAPDLDLTAPVVDEADIEALHGWPIDGRPSAR